MVKYGLLFTGLFFVVFASTSFGQITMSTSGNWSDPTVWTAGTVPVATSGTTAAPVSVGQPVTIDQDITITSGVYRFGWTGAANSGTNATDQPGGTAYNLSVSNAPFSATQSIVEVRSGTTTFEGTGYFDNATLTIATGGTLILGPTTVDNKVVITVSGTLIINGDFDLANNGSTSTFIINTGGLVLVYGNFTAPVGNVQINGGGDLFTVGSLTTTGSSTVFNSQGDCATGPCSGRNLCEISNGVIVQNNVALGQVLCSGSIPTQLTGTTSPGVTTYQWQSAVSLDAFTQVTGASDISGATSSTYTPPTYTTTSVRTDFYRLYIEVPSTVDPSGFCKAYSFPIQILTLGPGGWFSNTNNLDATRDDWNVGANWCGTSVPTPSTAVYIYSFPAGSGRLMPAIKSADAHALNVTIGSGANSNGISNAALSLDGGYTLNIYGSSSGAATTFNNNGLFTSASTGTVAFVGTSNSNSQSQSIGGTSFNSFGNLTLNNTGLPTTGANYTLKNNNIVVQSTLTLTQGKLNLNGVTLQLGTSPANKGTLSYTAGWMYGGNLQRYFGTAATTLADGLFPLGLSTTDYRPFALSYSSALTTGGYVRVSHTGTQYTFLDPADFADLPTATTVKRTSVSNWVSSASGLSGGGTSVTIQAGGTSFSDPAVLSDFRVTLVGSTIGANGTSSGTATDPRVQRTGLTVGNLSNTFYLGTINEVATPLPIDLVSFSANKKINGVELLWKTSTEENLDFFEVERSINGKDFTRLGVMKGNGTTNEEHAYNLFDEKPTIGKNYYRLKSVDFDGYTEYFNVVMVDFDGSKSFSIAPNPSDGITFTAQTNFTPTARAFVAIYTTLGAEVARYEVAGNNSILTLPVKLESGIYFAKYISNDFTSTNRVVVK